MQLPNEKQAIKEAILKILRHKAGVWVTFSMLSDLVDNILGEPAWRGAMNRAIYELIRDGQIQRTKQSTNHNGLMLYDTLYRVPDNDTPDLFGESEVK